MRHITRTIVLALGVAALWGTPLWAAFPPGPFPPGPQLPLPPVQVLLVVDPPSPGTEGRPVKLTAITPVQNLPPPIGPVQVEYHFSVHRRSDNTQMADSGWIRSREFPWTPGPGSAAGSPYVLSGEVRARPAAGQTAEARNGIENYVVHAAKGPLTVNLCPRGPGGGPTPQTPRCLSAGGAKAPGPQPGVAVGSECFLAPIGNPPPPPEAVGRCSNLQNVCPSGFAFVSCCNDAFGSPYGPVYALMKCRRVQ